MKLKCLRDKISSLLLKMTTKRAHLINHKSEQKKEKYAFEDKIELDEKKKETI